jgi:hypothetical protein
MQINFFDDPQKSPRSREDVRINQLGLYVYPTAAGWQLVSILRHLLSGRPLK